MSNAIPVEVKGVIPTKDQSCLIFVGNEEKVFMIVVDIVLGQTIAMFINGISKDRPLTHDLMGLIFKALDVKLERVVVNQLKNNTFYARLILRVDNEIHHKILEIDARPSDSIALALQAKAPIFVSKQVWDEVEDMNELLQSLTSESENSENKEEEGGDEGKQEK